MPVYNEANTVQKKIIEILNKKIYGFEIDLIIVESNSTDGSKEIVKNFKNNKNIKILFQKKPLGKGNAVREGLKVCSGDIILIQDADDEYSVDDYDKLLEPLITNKASFVLGTRHHSNVWKIRTLENEPFKEYLLNVGHIFFTFLVNLFCSTKLKDPFTMYKVFFRSCIKNIYFEANRFDFDYELVIKLIRAGHLPIEVPINYKSRSFGDGKKIRLLYDPFTWIYAVIKYRFGKLYKNDTLKK